MDITAAEQALTRFAAERLGLTVDESIFRGSVPEGLTGVAVRFESGIPGTDRPAEFTARIFGIFDEPDEAREFAERLWGGLPKYGVGGFIEIAPNGRISFEEADGRFTATGFLRAVFA